MMTHFWENINKKILDFDYPKDLSLIISLINVVELWKILLEMIVPPFFQVVPPFFLSPY